MATYDTFTIDGICLLVQWLIRAGVVFRVVFCLVKLMIADEEAAQYRRRIKNAVGFLVLSELVFSLKNIIISYYS